MGYLLTLCAASQRQPGSDKNPESQHCVQEQAAALHAVGMLDYCQLKDRILIATAALVAGGGSLCFAMGGWEATEPFLMGGFAALLYQRMLQANVDALSASQYSRVCSSRPLSL